MTQRSVAGLLLVTPLLVSACSFATTPAPSPNGLGTTQNVAQSEETLLELPGMPDRPETAEDAKMGYYRNDFPEAIAATGRPQLVVFWAPNNEDSVCFSCDQIRPVVQNIEAEYWDRVDVIYLNFALPESQPGLAYFDIENRRGQYIFFIDEKGAVIRRYSLGWRTMPEENDFRFTFDRYLSGELDS